MENLNCGQWALLIESVIIGGLLLWWVTSTIYQDGVSAGKRIQYFDASNEWRDEWAKLQQEFNLYRMEKENEISKLLQQQSEGLQKEKKK